MAYKLPLSEPIAIVGSGCRFAGGVTSPSKLWTLLSGPKDLSQEVPPSRFNIQGFYHPDGEYHGTTNSPKAYWLEQDHRVFDATFFSITPKEAEAIDPQQRMLLEVVYEALESAGYTLQQYAGDKVSVFSGLMTADYDTLSQRDDLTASQYYATGNARSILSNRISYFFNFRGPSMTIDTACSSSLVALHQAVLSLRSGESVMACVTGANLMITPEQFIVESNLHMLSPTGHCRMWDAAADGYARGEGVAALFIKPLRRALADGDRIEAIIRETGVNSDGRTKGITMPNPEAQATLIQDTYRKTGLDPRDPFDRCQYFEAHGTGTHAGDPREAAAINEAFFGNLDEARDVDLAVETNQRLLVGSIKTVFGHTEGAAGLAGILKVVQSMKHNAIPPNLHFSTLSPSVEPFYKHLQIPTTLTAWPSSQPGQPIRASVNSFGFGGANSHAIVEKYEPLIHDSITRNPGLQLALKTKPLSAGVAWTPPKLPLLFSANSQASLAAVVLKYREYLACNPSVPTEQIAWHLYSTRTALPYRLALTGSSKDDITSSLDALIARYDNGLLADLGTRSSIHDGPLQILGIFTGQGAQWATMSRGLFQTSHLYRRTIRELDLILQGSPQPPEWSLEQQILADDEQSSVGISAVSQPLCTAIQIALVDLLRSLGVTFSCVIGHSSGEVAAAYAAGRLTARDAMLIAYYRGFYTSQAVGRKSVKGGMVAAGISIAEAEELCNQEGYVGRICVAASNAATSVTISGDLDAVEETRDRLVTEGKFARLLKVDAAYHSPHMEIPAREYLKALDACRISPPSVGNGAIWISSVYGDPVDAWHLDLESTYWRDNMVKPVLFSEALQAALRGCEPFDCAIEVGPHPTLRGPAIQTIQALADETLPYTGLLSRGKDDKIAFAEFLGFMWAHFGPNAVNLRRFVEVSSQPGLTFCRLEDAPSYPWDHSQIYYRESRIARQYHFRPAGPHELLGVRTRDDTEFELRWRNILKVDKLPWIQGHKFQGQVLLPASAYCVMALDAAKVLLKGRPASLVELEDLQFVNGITLDHDTQGVEVLFSLSTISPLPKNAPPETIEATFNLTSGAVVSNGVAPMKKNFEGRMRIVLGEAVPEALPSREVCRSETLPVASAAFYAMMSGIDLDYSGPFQGIETMRRRYNFATATLSRFHPDDATNLAISPARLDSCLQTAYAAFASPGDKSLWTPFLPRAISRMRFNLAVCSEAHRDGTMSIDAHLTGVKPSTSKAAPTISSDICVFNSDDEMEIQVEGLLVASFAANNWEDEHELYLHTVLDIDPEDEIVALAEEAYLEPDAYLIESCQRVASYYLSHSLPSQFSPHLVSPFSTMQENVNSINLDYQWTEETEESLEHFIKTSPHYCTLSFVQTLGTNLPDVLSGMLPAVIHEARQLHAFQRHISRVVRQIAHRYPQMDILGVTDPELDLTGYVLDGLKSAFASFTVGVLGNGDTVPDHLLQSAPVRKKVSTVQVDLNADLDTQLASNRAFDLAILSTSIPDGQSTMAVLKNARRVMKPGGFLLLVNPSPNSLRHRLERCTTPKMSSSALLTPPDWPDVLEACDFVRLARNSDQHFSSGFSLIVRQADGPKKEHVMWPLSDMKKNLLVDHLLIIGGQTEQVSHLSSALHQELLPRCKHLSLAKSLGGVDVAVATSCTGIILLSDLEEPVLASLTEQRLDTLKALIKPEVDILWLTLNARDQDPGQSASYGFSRTILAETPGLSLQMLDLDTLTNRAEMIVETFVRLALHDEPSEFTEGEVLWSAEPEIYIENGRRLVPRVLPWKDGNDRVNAHRRIVSNIVNSLQSCVEIIPAQENSRFSTRGTMVKDVDLSTPASRDIISLQVHYSSAVAVQTGQSNASYICIGRDARDTSSGNVFVALSKSNASFISVISRAVHPVQLATSSLPHFAAVLLRFVASLSIATDFGKREVLMVDPDDLLKDCAREALGNRGISLKVCVTKRATKEDRHDVTVLHPLATTREVKKIFPRRGAIVFDFLAPCSALSKAIEGALPKNCEYRRAHDSLFTPEQLSGNSHTDSGHGLLEEAVSLTLTKISSTQDLLRETQTISPSGLVQASAAVKPFTLLDWRADRLVQHIAKPLVEENLLSPNKTYVLVGMTRDFGQSICSLFREHGARNLAVASRNPDISPAWKDEAMADGINIRIERLDVTDLDGVKALRGRLATSMPPVAGIVNGAMVLDDRVFSEMDLETLNRVMRPKTIGSKNLDLVFDSPDMEFFIMTSSFAAIGGHAGQSNYAAANMYMNGLAANRRRRGLVGSVLNIGVIYGLGLLARERQDIYTGLEREGYPPISERDLHHMFLEAIVAGRPTPNQVRDITTGLRRYRANGPYPLHWHRDPRFSHYTVGGEDNNEGGSGNGDVIDGHKKQSVRELIENAENVDDIVAVLVPCFVTKLEALLQLPARSVDKHHNLADLGVDSLVAVEIRSWLYKVVGQDVPVMKILGSASIRKLCQEIAIQVEGSR